MGPVSPKAVGDSKNNWKISDEYTKGALLTYSSPHFTLSTAFSRS